MPFTPRNDRVLIRRIQREETFAEGKLLLPETARQLPQDGEVLAVGPGARHHVTGEIIPIGLNPGDRVTFLPYAGTIVEADGEPDLVCIQERDVLGIVT